MDDPIDAEDPQPSGGPELAEGIEHLQHAARELVAAARSFLDVVEQVVEDDERLSGAASTIADMVGRGLGSTRGKDLAGGLLSGFGGLGGREPAWLRNDPDHPDATDTDDAAVADHVDDPDVVDDAACVDDAGGADDFDLLFGDATRKPPAPTVTSTPRTRRVTRISVD
ncbi:MAG: hypothetical protein M3Y51_05935 [Actinomycetota bacterium]|nr:hypothetical protein [Actinomycetota bacterium]